MKNIVKIMVTMMCVGYVNALIGEKRVGGGDGRQAVKRSRTGKENIPKFDENIVKFVNLDTQTIKNTIVQFNAEYAGGVAGAIATTKSAVLSALPNSLKSKEVKNNTSNLEALRKITQELTNVEFKDRSGNTSRFKEKTVTFWNDELLQTFWPKLNEIASDNEGKEIITTFIIKVALSYINLPVFIHKLWTGSSEVKGKYAHLVQIIDLIINKQDTTLIR